MTDHIAVIVPVPDSAVLHLVAQQTPVTAQSVMEAAADDVGNAVDVALNASRRTQAGEVEAGELIAAGTVVKSAEGWPVYTFDKPALRVMVPVAAAGE